MIRLYYIRLCTKDGELQVRRDYDGLLFKDEKVVNRFIIQERDRFRDVVGLELFEDPFFKEVPNIINIKEIITSVCREMDMAKEFVFSKTRRRDAAEARMFITQICLDLGVLHGELRRWFPNGVTYHYEKQMKRLRADKKFDKRFTDIKDNVL